MFQILNIDPEGYSPVARARLQEIGHVDEQLLGRDILLDVIGKYDILITGLALQIDPHVIDAGKQLRAIVTATTGIDHIDVEYAQARGVRVLSLKGESEFLKNVYATAELTWGLVLALTRKIPWAFASVCQGHWDRNSFRGTELAGKKLGILGLGRLGRMVAEYGLAFRMQVGSYDPYCTNWPNHIERFDSLSDLLAGNQVISIHVPLNAETRNLIGANELMQMPSGAVLLNTARGAVVDSKALVAALETGHLAGAAIDVVENERETPGLLAHPLVEYARTHSNLLITPHIGGATRESMHLTQEFMAEKLLDS